MALEEDYRILIADDDEMIREFIVKMLNELGHTNLVEASDGEQAWRILQKEGNKIKIFLCDWNMPKLSGLDLLKKMKGASKLEQIHFLMVTAETDLEHTTSALLNGANGYVTKPFDIHVLRAELNQAADRYNRESENSDVPEGTVLYKRMS